MKINRAAIFWVLLLLGGAAALFLFFFERYSEQVDRGFGPEARRNSYLAAERFLARVGIQSRRADNIAALTTLKNDDVLFLASSSQIYSSARLQELLDWVASGGRAIVVATGSGDELEGEGERDRLLDYLELEITRGNLDLYFNRQVREVFGEQAAEIQDVSASEMMREHNRRLDGGETTQVGNTDTDTGEAAPVRRDPEVDDERLIYLTSDSGASYTLYFNPSRVLTHELMLEENETQLEDGRLYWVRFQNVLDQSPLVQLDLGRGRLTVLADGGLWQNDRIGEFDHAYFLAHLVGERNLVMITRPHFESLSALAERYAQEFFLAALLALLAWVANRSRRFGPLTPAPPAERRSLLEHIRACGQFYWRSDRAHHLFESSRRPLLQKVCGLPADAANSLPQEQRRQMAEAVASRTGLAASEIFTVLWEEAPRREDDFTARMRSIQIIEAAL